MMFTPPDPCPGAAELRRFAAGKLPTEAHERLASHVESCARCLGALESTCLRADSLVVEVRRAAKLTAVPEGHDALTPHCFLDGYEILRELGRGGMGIVYLARQPGADRLVALKQIRPDALAGLSNVEREKVLARFQREARAAARLRSGKETTWSFSVS